MNKLSKHIKYAALSGVVIFIVLKFINMLLGSPLVFNLRLLIQFAYFILYATTLYGVNAGAHFYLDKLYNNKYDGKRIALGFVTSVVLTLVAIFLLRIVEDVVIEGENFTIFLEQETPQNYIIPFIINIVVSLFFIAFFSFKALQDKKVNEQKIIAGTANAKYESLKSQIDPHFLFNSLNVLTSLIEENPKNAEKFTTSLSKVYRYVLEQKDKDLVSLEEELKFAKTYMTLLKMRFEDAIQFQIPETVKNPEAKIVPLSLQILLENCIKHNVVSEQKPLRIVITEKEGVLEVTNNLQIKKTLKNSTGVGLKNITERYQILSNRNMKIYQSENEYKVHLPLLTKKASIMKVEITPNYENSNYVHAKKRIKKLKDFYGSLAAYIIIMPFLVFINLKTGTGVYWFWFPMFGWGVGLAFQAYEVFGANKYFGKSWEDRKMKEFMEEDKQNNNRYN